MKKHNHLLTLGAQVGIMLVTVVLVAGTAFAALGESSLYDQHALVATTAVPSFTNTTVPEEPEVIEPTPTNTRIVTATLPPSKTQTSTQSSTKTLTRTSTSTPTNFGENPTEEVCGPPSGWMQYTVQPGDNLYRISLKFRVSVAELKAANCMGDSTVIVSGESLWVPDVATSTPIASYTPTTQGTNSSSSTNTLIAPTATPTNTLEPTPESSPTTGITQTKTLP